MSTFGNYLETMKWIFYDLEELDSNGHAMLFVQPARWEPDGKGKKLEQTNMLASSSLPAPQTFKVERIRLLFFGRDGRTVQIDSPVYWGTCFEFFVHNETFWRSPAGMLADPRVVIHKNEWSRLRGRDKELLLAALLPDFSIEIEQQMMFNARIYSDPKWHGYRLLCGLEGILSRPRF